MLYYFIKKINIILFFTLRSFLNSGCQGLIFTNMNAGFILKVFFFLTFATLIGFIVYLMG